MTSPARSSLAAVSLAALCLAPPTVLAQQPRGGPTALPSGSWLVALPAGADTTWARFTLRFERDSVFGANAGGVPVAGSRRRDSVTFSVLRPAEGARVLFAGVLRNGVIRGTRVATRRGASLPADSASFLAMPEPAPSRTPRRQAFEPQVFHRWFSGSVPPALRLVGGDTVRTWSVDAGGRDSTGTVRSRGGNPLTGPFYIEGTLPRRRDRRQAASRATQPRLGVRGEGAPVECAHP